MFARAFAIVAYVIGMAGAGLFYAYVVGTGTGLWPRDESAAVPASYGWNFGFLLLFAVQHSGMQRRTFWKLSPHLERSAYVLASGGVLGAMTLLWHPMPGDLIWNGPIWLVAISGVGVFGILYCAKWFDHATFFGLQQAWTGDANTKERLIIAGPYRFVRHPLMLALLVAVWGQPIMPPELLWMNIGVTADILFAIKLEERDLLRDFGEAYESYRKQVPALIPWRAFVAILLGLIY